MLHGHRIMVSVITYSEMRVGATVAILMTNNVREFEREPGLVLKGWVK